MSILVSGSIAYDTIMVFQDQFKRHILPDQLHILNVSFLVPEMRRNFGGCAGNIAYNLHLLGEKPLIVGTMGEDSQAYREHWRKLGIDATFVRDVEDSFTAQAFITTDLDDNQITAFHPGAMSFSHFNSVADVPSPSIAIVAPNGRDGMVQHARECAQLDVPFIFDPGQGLPLFDGDDLIDFIDQASFCAVNDYEAQVVCERTGLTLAEIGNRVEALFVTRGGEGCVIYCHGEVAEVPAAPVARIVDPTGCGDAFRAGLLYGLARNWDLIRCAELASVMGAIKIEHRGGQSHHPSYQDIATRYEYAFGRSL
jgi:adenosine kinase